MAMTLRLGLIAAGLAGLLNAVSSAQPVYKSVNADGSISYGDKPARAAEHIEEVPILPGPSVDAVLDAMYATEKIKESAAALEAERLAKEHAIERERELIEAQQAEQRERELAAAAAAEAAEQERLAELEEKQPKKKKKQKKNNHPPPLDVPVPWKTPGPPAVNMAPGTPLLNLPGPGE